MRYFVHGNKINKKKKFVSCARATTWTAREIRRRRRRRKRTVVNESTGSATTPPPPAPPVVSRARVPDRDSRTAATALVDVSSPGTRHRTRPRPPVHAAAAAAISVICRCYHDVYGRRRRDAIVIRHTLSDESVFFFLSLAHLTVFRVRTFGSTTGVAIVRTRLLRATTRFTSVVSVTSRVNITYTPLR